jgi:hypothetical protein
MNDLEEFNRYSVHNLSLDSLTDSILDTVKILAVSYQQWTGNGKDSLVDILYLGGALSSVAAVALSYDFFTLALVNISNLAKIGIRYCLRDKKQELVHGTNLLSQIDRRYLALAIAQAPITASLVTLHRSLPFTGLSLSLAYCAIYLESADIGPPPEKSKMQIIKEYLSGYLPDRLTS